MHAHLLSTRELILSLESAIGEDIIGQHDLIRKLIITLLAGGHALIE
jgi:MoxR-like ATPase